MYKNGLRFVIAILSLFALAGCGGGDSQTTGQLTLSASANNLTGGLFNIDAQAVYASPSGGSLENFPITITFTVTAVDGTELRPPVTNSLDANSAGVVTSNLLINQTNQVAVVKVRASSGGLSDQEILLIPAITAMTSSPAVVAFPLDALAGATQTVTISGGVAPYTAQIDAAHAPDISVSVNGNLIILTKLRNSVLNGPALVATLTVSDASGATPIAINVSYN